MATVKVMASLAKGVFGTAWAWLSSHVRLLIEYVLIAVFVALAGFAVQQHHHGVQLEGKIAGLNKSVGSLKSNITQLKGINADQDKAIQGITFLRQLDSTAISSLQAELAHNAVTSKTTRDKIKQLEATNVAAKRILDIRISPALQCVLDDTCKTGRGDENKAGNKGPSG